MTEEERGLEIVEETPEPLAIFVEPTPADLVTVEGVDVGREVVAPSVPAQEQAEEILDGDP